MTQAGKFSKAKVHSQDEDQEKESCPPWDLGFCLLLAIVNKRVEYSLVGVEFSQKQGFPSFLSYLLRGFLL